MNSIFFCFLAFETGYFFPTIRTLFPGSKIKTRGNKSVHLGEGEIFLLIKYTVNQWGLSSCLWYCKDNHLLSLFEKNIKLRALEKFTHYLNADVQS